MQFLDHFLDGELDIYVKKISLISLFSVFSYWFSVTILLYALIFARIAASNAATYDVTN